MSQTITYSQYLLSQDSAFIGRIASVLKDEGYSPPGEAPVDEAAKISADVAAEPGVAESYHGALLAGRSDAGSADDVITDEALLSAVAAVVGQPIRVNKPAAREAV